jgi:hypothetical protein
MGVILSIVGGIVCIIIGFVFLALSISVMIAGSIPGIVFTLGLTILFFVVAGFAFRDADKAYHGRWK